MSLFTKLLKGVPANLFVQVFRYFIVGGIAFAVDFGLLYVLTEYLGVYYLFSASLSFFAGLVVNYLCSIKWVFRDYTLGSRFWEFVVFGLIGCIGLLLNAVFMYVFTEVCLLYYLYSKLLSTFLVFAWNFSARRFILFRETGKKDVHE